jgi:hypothetical protein
MKIENINEDEITASNTTKKVLEPYRREFKAVGLGETGQDSAPLFFPYKYIFGSEI